MRIPDKIPFASIELGERGRSSYSGIEQLAQSIEDHGLIQPLVLVPLNPDGVGGVEIPTNDGYYGLDAGGRRYHALKLLDVTELHHAVTSEPGRYGFILKGETFCSPLERLMTEISENLDREDPDWRDQVKMFTRAYRMAKQNADANSEKLLMRDFGSALGCGYSDLQAAVFIHDDVIANPERYKDITGIRAAAAKLLKINATELVKLQAAKSLMTSPLSTSPPPVQVQSAPRPEGSPDPVVIPLTQSFIHTDSIKFMETLDNDAFDHIVTDPDYGVSVERLEASSADASSGVHQDNVLDSLTTMANFLQQAWRIVKPGGFCVFWYDLDHHEKLQLMATGHGWRVQRWPLIWVKSDYRSNAAASHNFCKNIEYAMVCRKPNAILVKAQMSSVFMTGSADVVRQFSHPFAKPLDLWSWIFGAISIKGQVVYDPFLGSGSSAVAALNFGLRPVGTEINIDHYSNAVLNIQSAYKKLIGEHVRFS